MTPSIGIGIAIPFQKGSTFCKEYKAVYNAFTNKPSAADAVIQNAKMLAIVAGGRYAKSERHWEFSAHTNAAGESQFDWIDPVNHLPVTNVNGAAWDAYNGFTGAVTGTKYLRSNFTPSVDGTIIGQDNICAIIGVGTNLNEALYDFGCESIGGASRLEIASNFGNNAYFGCNSSYAVDSIANINGKKYFAMSRNAATNFDSYINLIKTNFVRSSNVLPAMEIYACGRNWRGTVYSCNRQLRFAHIGSYLTEGEIQSAIGDENLYLTNYSTNLY